MSKKLNISSISNELSQGSAFFPRRQQGSSSQPEKRDEKIIERKADQDNQQIPVRPNARTDVRPNGRRIIKRHAFEVYDDQVDRLRELSLKEKMDGKLGSMSNMVREAIDMYLKENSR